MPDICCAKRSARRERRADCADLEDDVGGRAPSARQISACRPSSSASIPAPLNSSPSLRTSTPPTRKRTKPTSDRPPKIAILGSGPNRIGQGIEFDYCCCHASFALREDGYETIMVNCNPETVSTDYDTSDRLYFEPLTLEDVLARDGAREAAGRDRAIWRADAAESGARSASATASPLSAPPPESIDLAEDRRRFGRLLDELKIPQPRNGTALTCPKKPRAWRRKSAFRCWCARATCWAGAPWSLPTICKRCRTMWRRRALMGPARPVLIDQFLEEATEVDVDALADGETWSSAASWNTSKKPACTRAILPACCRR